MNGNVDEVVRRLAPGPELSLTPLAREVMTEIMDAEPAPAARRRGMRRPLVVLPLAAAVAAAAWAVPSLLRPAPAAALDIREEGGFYVIQVKDLYADADVYERQLKGLGLDVSLRVVPATPSFVGEISPSAREREPAGPFVHRDQINTIDSTKGCGMHRSCPIGLRIAKDFTGSADVILGRAARRGEKYEIIGGLAAPGEPMNCVPFYNRPVSEVRVKLRKLGLSVGEYAVTDRTKGSREVETRASVPDSMYVVGGYLSSYGTADLFVDRTPMQEELVRTLVTKHGCPG